MWIRAAVTILVPLAIGCSTSGNARVKRWPENRHRRDATIAELARRIEALEARVETLEGQTTASARGRPERLDREMVTVGLQGVRDAVLACGTSTAIRGEVVVVVAVGSDGRVASVSVRDTPDVGLGGCVAAAVQRATFAPTRQGGTFSSPYRF